MKQICIFLIALFAFCSTSQGQDKSIFNPEILDMGDGKIISSTLNESGDYVFQEFEVEVEKSGKYYLAAWVNGALYPNGEKLEYKVIVNGEKEEYNIRAEKEHPHTVDFGTQMFDLRSGVNKITFKTRKPYCPNVEFIKVSQDELDRQISSEKYDQFIDEITKQTLPDNYAELKEASLKKELSQTGLKSAPDPLCNYDYELDLDFKYSYYTMIWLSKDDTVTFETKYSWKDPVIHLFNWYDQSYSWTDDDSGAGSDDAKLTVIIDNSAFYYLLIRKGGASDGVCDLYMNNSLYAYYCVFSGSRIQCTETVSETMNWFTADLTGDSHIWLENQDGTPGKIISFNDDCAISSDFTWGNNSRIRKYPVSNNVEALIVSSHTSSYPTGSCDLYMNCLNSSTTKVSNSNDAIQSATSSTAYNCYSWSGGRLDLGRYFKPDQYDSPWKASSYYGQTEYELYSFDNFYGNRDDDNEMTVRYTSQQVMNFSRSGATASNAAVALWSETSNDDFDHAAVKKPANEQPHGYDWESKDGNSDRFFHPIDELSGYGTIRRYYQPSGWSSGTQPPDKKAANALGAVRLTNVESDLLSKMADDFPDKTRFDNLYDSWKNTWDESELVHQSNRRMFAKSEQYTDLVEYCHDQGKEVWPLVFNKFVEGEELSMMLIADLTREKYSWLMDEIIKQQNRECAKEGIAPSPRTNGINYLASLLGKLKSSEVTDILGFNDKQSINVYPNPAGNIVNIKIVGLQRTQVVIKICDLSGKVLKSVSNNIMGDHTFNINIEDIPDGTYICKIESNNKVRTSKLNVMR